jgi:hypothetical protein
MRPIGKHKGFYIEITCSHQYYEEEVVDMLIQYLYVEKPTSKKTTLWKAFGEVMVKNLQYNLEHQLELCSE